MSPDRPSREDVFARLYAEQFTAVLGYALRRVDRAADAADVCAETFLVAWRRLDHVPPGSEARPWLYGVARRVLANQRRGDRRRTTLGRRLHAELAAAVPDCGNDVATRTDVDRALDRLSGRDQEVLRLHLWEGLESREIAEVLGLTTVVVRPRLSRARARLRDLLGNDPPPGGHPSSSTTHQLARKDQ